MIRSGSQATTQGCSRHRHREFALSYDERRTPSADVRRLIDALERSVARGERFHPGETVRVGWMSLRVAEFGGNTLTLLEPDFIPLRAHDLALGLPTDGRGRLSEAPTRWVEGVDEALGQLRFQQEVADGAGLGDQVLFGSIEQRARVCMRLLDRELVPGFVLDRVPPQGGDSGWIIGCADDPDPRDGRDGHDTVECTLYQVASRWPFLVDFLALPGASTIACTETGEATIFHEGREVAILSVPCEPRGLRISRVTRPSTLARCVR